MAAERGLLEKVKVPAAGSLGAFTGVAIGELATEIPTRYFNLGGNVKYLVKIIGKIIIGAILWFGSSKIPGLSSVFLEIASYGSFGSIFFDVISILKPGGLMAIAEETALALKGMGASASAAAASATSVESAAGVEVTETGQSLAMLKGL